MLTVNEPAMQAEVDAILERFKKNVQLELLSNIKASIERKKVLLRDEAKNIDPKHCKKCKHSKHWLKGSDDSLDWLLQCAITTIKSIVDNSGSETPQQAAAELIRNLGIDEFKN